MISQTTIDRVKDLPCDTVLSHFVVLKNAGGGKHTGLCPFHEDSRTGNFYVFAKTNTYKCFACGASGDGISFVRQKLNVGFAEAIEQIAKQNGIEISYESRQNGYSAEEYKKKQAEREQQFGALEQAQKHFRSYRKEAEQYLSLRKFTPETGDFFGLGYSPNTNHFAKQNNSAFEAADLVRTGEKGKYDTFRNRLTIPLKDRSGRVIGFAGRALEPNAKAKYINPTETAVYNKSRYLYNYDAARTHIEAAKTAIVVEGYPNVWRLHQEGIYHAVATCGTALTAEHISELKRSTKNIVIGYDADSAGFKATVRSLPMLLSAGLSVSILPLPSGMDLDDLARYLGGYNAYQEGKTLKQYIDAHCQTWVAWKIQTFQEANPQADQAANVEFVHHLAELILSYPDAAMQQLWVEEVAKSYKLIKTSYKSKQKDKREAEKKTSTEDVVKVIVEEGATIVLNSRGILAPIGNFSIKMLYQLQIPNTEDCDWILELKRKNQEAEYLVISNKDITSAKALETAFYAKRYAIDADDKQRRYLRAYLIEQGLKVAKKVETLGYHPESGLFFFSNVAYDYRSRKLVEPNHLSIIDRTDGGYFMPYTEPSRTPKDKSICRYEPCDKVNFDDIAEFVCKAWGAQEALSMAFLAATAYMDIIINTTANFPILFLMGPAGSGKSELAKLLMNFAGRGMGENLSVGANSSTAAMKEFFSSYANIPFHIEDYSRSSNLSELSDFLVLLFDRNFRKTMDRENLKSVKILTPLASCVISSNKPPLEDGSEALASRLIYLQMRVNTRTAEHKQWFMQTKARLYEQSWTEAYMRLLPHRNLIEKHFEEYYVKYDQLLSKKLKAADYIINDRIIKSYCAIIAPLCILFDNDLTTCFVPNEISLTNALLDIAYTNIVKQHNSLVEKSPLQVFWDTVQSLYNDYKTAEAQAASYIDKNGNERTANVPYNPYLIYPNSHFQIWEGHQENGMPIINERVIRLKIDDVYGRYVARMKHLGATPERLNTLKDMMRQHRSYEPEVSEKYMKFRPLEGDQSSPTKKGFILKYRALQEDFAIDLD